MRCLWCFVIDCLVGFFLHVLLLVVYPFLKNRFVHLLLEFYWLLWELWHSSLTKERGLSEREVIFILNETGYWLVACLLSFIFYRVLEGTGKELNMSGTGEKTYKVLWLVRDLKGREGKDKKHVSNFRNESWKNLERILERNWKWTCCLQIQYFSNPSRS